MAKKRRHRMKRRETIIVDGPAEVTVDRRCTVTVIPRKPQIAVDGSGARKQ